MELDTEVRMPSCMMAMQGLGDTGVMYPNVTIDRPSCMYTLSPHSSPDMFENKYYVHSSKENVRGAVCKRRLDFSEDHSQDYLAFHKTPTVAVARRNERERNRVKLINLTFATLREHIPSQSKNGKAKKMSKVDTLKAAIDYIRYLQQLVDEHDAVSNVMDNTCGQRRTQTSTTKNNDLKLDSKPSSSAASPCSENSVGGLSIEEEELLDFAAWF